MSSQMSGGKRGIFFALAGIAAWLSGGGGLARAEVAVLESRYSPLTLSRFDLLYDTSDWGLSWTDANTAAQAMGGRLVLIDSPWKNQAVAAFFAQYEPWIGLTDDEAYGGSESSNQENPKWEGWVWVHPGGPTPLWWYEYQNWGLYEPNDAGGGEDYTQMTVTGRWNDLPNDWLRPAVAEFPEAIQRYDWNVSMDGRFSDPYCWRQGSNPPPQGPPGAMDAAFFSTGNSEWPYTVTIDPDTSVAMLAVGWDNVVLRTRGYGQVGELYAGFGGSTSRLEIRRAGVSGGIHSGWAVLGLDSGASAYVTLTYVEWMNDHQIVVGSSGYAELNAEGMILQADESVILGQLPGGYGHVRLRGSQISAGELLIGYQGNADLWAEYSAIQVGWLGAGCEIIEMNPEYPTIAWGSINLDSSSLQAYGGMSIGYRGQSWLWAYASEISTGGTVYLGYEGPWSYGAIELNDSSMRIGGLSWEPCDLWVGGNNGSGGFVRVGPGSYLEVSGSLYLGVGREEGSWGGYGYMDVGEESSVLVRGSTYIGSNLREGAVGAEGSLYLGMGSEPQVASEGAGGQIGGGEVSIQGDLSIGENRGDGTSQADGYLSIGWGSQVTVGGDVGVGNNLGANSSYAYGGINIYGGRLVVQRNMRVGSDLGGGAFESRGYIQLEEGASLEIGGNLILEEGNGMQTYLTELNCWGASLTVGGRMHVGHGALVQLRNGSRADVQGGLRVEGYMSLGEESVLDLHGSGLSLGQYSGTLDFGAGRFQDPGPINGSIYQYGGVMAPGPVVRTVTVSGNYLMNSAEGSPVLEMDLAGAAGGLYDRLVVGGLLRLAGELRICLEAGYMPVAGSVFDLLDWGSLQGEFGLITLPELASGLLWDLSQLYSNGVIRVITSLLGDTNGDGVVDLADYNNVVNNLGASGTNVLGDTNGDGVVDLADYNNVVNNLGASLPGGLAVPEPVAWIVLLPLGLTLYRRRAA